MNAETWIRLEQLFYEASSLSEAERAAFLNERCAGDSALLSELERLFAAGEHADSFLNQASEEGALLADSLGEREQRAGPWRLVRLLGRGGMGAVYLGERADEQFTQRAAIKLVRADLTRAEVFKRFYMERQILARLEHPNIARLLDGGVTSTGLPYVAMEFVDGIPVTQFAEQHALSTRERLALFRLICSAVQYAHQFLIIHRDIKPANILVTAEGVPKLLDFGIAKLLAAEELGLTAGLTRMDERPMTSQYASPEQVRGEPVGTASDVYSLGILLYQLLTGTLPYEVAGQRPAELERLVCEKDPELPSAAVMQKGNVRNDIPRERLRAQLSGDLDRITAKALCKETTARYGSVEQFSEDIRLYLEGFPVRARGNHRLYRWSRFVRRNRVPVAAAAVLVAGLSTAGVLTWSEKVRAQRRFDEVRQLAHSYLFEFHDAVAKLPGSTPVRQLLVTRALHYLDELSKDAGNDSELQSELADAYQKVADIQWSRGGANIGDMRGAMESLRKAMAIREKMVAARPHDLNARTQLARCNAQMSDLLLQDAKSMASADSFGDRALSLINSVLKEEPDNSEAKQIAAQCETEVGVKSLDRGHGAVALEHFRRAQELYEDAYRRDPSNVESVRHVALAWMHIGDAVGGYAFDGQLGDRKGALADYQKGEELLDKLAAAHPNDTILLRALTAAETNVAIQFDIMGDHVSELAEIQKVIAISERLSQLDPSDTYLRRGLAISYQIAGEAERSLGRLSEAMAWHRKHFEITESLWSAHPDTLHVGDLARAYHQMGALYEQMGDLARAVQYHESGIKLRQPLIDAAPNEENLHWRQAMEYSALGGLYAKLHQCVKARVALGRSRDLFIGLRDRGRLAPRDLGEPDRLAREMAACVA